AAGHQLLPLHGCDEIRQPVGVGDAVAVGVGDDLAGCGLGADVPRNAQALVGLADDARIGKAFGDLERAVGRAVVDDDHFVVGIVEILERCEACLHGPLGVVG